MPIDPSWYQKPKKVRERRAAGGVVVRVDEARQILVAFVGEGGASDYVLPKGGVEKGESDEQAARREIEEEAGLKRLTLLEDLGVVERLNYSKSRWVRTHFFLFRTDQTTGQPTDRRHRYAAAWFPIDQLPPIFWPEQKELIEANRELIAGLIRPGE